MDIPRFGIPEKLADRMSMAEQHDYLRTRLTRRGALRTGVATAAVVGTGLGLASSPAYAAPTVDLVINGHNHVYERTDAILKNAVKREVPIGERTDPRRDGIVYVTAGGAGKALYDFPAPDSYEGHVTDLESVNTYHVAKGGAKATETVEWSRVRYTGFSFLAVEVETGRNARMKVTALAESGERVDHFEISRG